MHFLLKGAAAICPKGQLLSFSFAANETRSQPRLPFDKQPVFTTILIIPIVRTNGNGSQSHPLLENSRGNHAKCIRGSRDARKKCRPMLGNARKFRKCIQFSLIYSPRVFKFLVYFMREYEGIKWFKTNRLLRLKSKGGEAYCGLLILKQLHLLLCLCLCA